MGSDAAATEASAFSLIWGSLFNRFLDPNAHYKTASKQDEMDQEANLGSVITTMMRRPSMKTDQGQMVPVYRLMDPVPHIILEDMPAPRFYSLYACGVVQQACNISNVASSVVFSREEI